MAALREIAAHFGVTFDDKSLKQGAASVDSFVDRLKGFAGALGAGLALGAIFHFVHGLTEEADALQKQADAMGMSLAEMQEWNYAAMMQGVSAETLAGVLNKLGSGKFDKGLASLGVSTKDASGEMRNSTDILEDVADSLSKIENPAERNRKAVAVLGKSYAKMLPLLQDGAKGIKELREEFQEMGGGFDEEFAKNADEFGDNIDRTKTIWKNFGILVVSQVLPTLVMLSKKVVALVKPMMGLIKNGKLLETGMAALAIKGMFFLSSKIGPLGSALKVLAGNFFRVILPLLILEDLLVFLAGGDSLLGRALDKLLGAGSAETTRLWIKGVWDEFMSFIRDIKTQPLKLLDDWHVFTNELSKDVVKLFGEDFGFWINTAGSVFVGFISLITGGWTSFAQKMGAIWDGVVIAMRIVWEELAGGFVHLAAIIADAFISAWNTVLGGFNKVSGAVDKALLALGLMSKAEYDANQKTMAGQYGKADLAETVERARAIDRTKLAADYDNAAARYNRADAKGSVGGSNVGVVNNTTINVPPGTPSAQVNAIAAGAQAGVNKGVGSLKAAQAATKPGGA